MWHYVISALVIVILVSSVDSTQDANSVDASINFEYKFDHGFYQKIQDIINDDRDGVHGMSTDPRYYSVILVVSRGHGDTVDEIAEENKDILVKRLESIGAKDIYRASSLSFVTAAIPVNKILKLSSYDEVFKLGDGELPMVPLIDQARKTIKATPRDLNQLNLRVNGSGVIVAVVDTGINSIYLNDKVSERIYCPNRICWANNGSIIGTPTYPIGLLNSTNVTHGTRIAQVIAESGMPSNNGIAPGVTLLDALTLYHNNRTSKYDYTINNNASTSFAESLDWSITQGADITSISIGNVAIECNSQSSTLHLVLNEAVDQGLVVVFAAGNESFRTDYKPLPNSFNYRSYDTIVIPGCAYNIITVGGIDDRANPITMYEKSSRGPANYTGPANNYAPILKPEIVAPADIVLVHNSTHLARLDGTSLAAPQVSAVAALMLEAEPNLTPTEVKALLLLGANWTGPIPCTSHQFEQNNASDNCSFARQPSDKNAANNSTSLSILNNVGFGILDTIQSLRYVQSSSNMISGDITTNATKRYEFNVTDTAEPVKVILSWLVHPHGNIRDQIGRITPAPFANLDFVVECGQQAIRANSTHQINEFAVFMPSQTGKCIITVTGSLQNITSSTQNYTLVSTHDIGPFTPSVNKTKPTDTTLTVTLPEPTKKGYAVIGIMTYADNSIVINTEESSIGNGTRYYDKHLSAADIIIHHETEILDKTFTHTRDEYCYEAIVLVGKLDDIPKDHTAALWFEFGRDSNPKKCDNAPDISFDGKLVLDKEAYVRFNNAYGQTPFYHISGTDHTVEIPKCTDTNFDSTDNTLKGNTEICYGKDNTDIIIVSKILAVFGVTDIKQISLFNHIPFHLTGTIDLYTALDKIRINTYYTNGTTYYINDKADIMIYRGTEIIGKKFKNDQTDIYCYVGDLLVNHNQSIPIQHTNTLQINFRQSSDPARCDTAPHISFDGKLDLSKEVYVRFVGTDGQTPFYYTDDITNIPKCSSTNFDHTANTLIGDTEICYGKDGNDTIIVSKILAVFGVKEKSLPNDNDSIITIPPPDALPNKPQFVGMVFESGYNDTIEIDGATYDKKGDTIKDGTRFTDAQLYSIGDVYITRTNIINVDISSLVHKEGIYCYSGAFTRVQQDRLDITIPLNESSAMGFQFTKDDDEYPVRDVYYSCTDIPDISFSGKILLDREIRVQLDDTLDRNPFYYVNGTAAVVPIPKCTDTNFDHTSQTLKDNTKACYGKYNNDIIIIAKMMTVFGTTTDTLVQTSKN